MIIISDKMTLEKICIFDRKKGKEIIFISLEEELKIYSFL